MARAVRNYEIYIDENWGTLGKHLVVTLNGWVNSAVPIDSDEIHDFKKAKLKEIERYASGIAKGIELLKEDNTSRLDYLITRYINLMNNRLEIVWEYTNLSTYDHSYATKEQGLVQSYAEIFASLDDVLDIIFNVDSRLLNALYTANPEDIMDAVTLYYNQARRKRRLSYSLLVKDDKQILALVSVAGDTSVYVNGALNEVLPNSPFVDVLFEEISRLKAQTKQRRV